MEMEMAARRLPPVCVLAIALALVAGVARAQTQQQDPGGAPSDPALELSADEPLDLSTPEPEELKDIRPLSERPLGSPTIPVAPPARAIAVCPASWNRRSITSPIRLPWCRLSAVGSHP